MRALSLSQPWLHAVLHFDKRVENRKWRPPVKILGQTIVLHAAKSWDRAGAEFLERLGFVVPERPTLAAGAIVGTAVVDGMVESFEQLAPDQARWFFGPYGWKLRDVVVLNDPIVHVTGSLGLWEVKPEDAYELTARLKVDAITGPRR